MSVHMVVANSLNHGSYICFNYSVLMVLRDFGKIAAYAAESHGTFNNHVLGDPI